MAATRILPIATSRANALWTAAQATSVAIAVGAVGLLLVRPAVGLFVVWSVLVPVVPALLLISPLTWRNLCPIAVLHQVPVRVGKGGRRRLPRVLRRIAPHTAGALFFLVVPLRLLLFNESGAALAAFVAAVIVIGLAAGVLFLGKSGWCATFCPVLPVERLYGQSPLLGVRHAHCDDCYGCVRSCYDLRPAGSMEEMLDPHRALSLETRDRSVVGSPMGVFAAGFPGFVLAYFTTPAGLAPVPLYGRFAIWVIASVAVAALLQAVFRASSRAAGRLTAGVGAAAYYWYSVPAIAAAAHELLDLPPATIWGIGGARAAALALVGYWLLAAVRRAAPVTRLEPTGRTPRPGPAQPPR